MERFLPQNLPRLTFAPEQRVQIKCQNKRLRSLAAGRWLFCDDQIIDPVSQRTVWSAGDQELLVGTDGQTVFSNVAERLIVRPLGDNPRPPKIASGYFGVGMTAAEDVVLALNAKRCLCHLDAKTGQERLLCTGNWPRASSFDAQGRHLLAQLQEARLEVWQLDPARLLCRHQRKSQSPLFRAHPRRTIFAFPRCSETVGWIDLERPFECSQLTVGGEALGLAWTGQGRYLCVSTGKLLWVLDFEARQLFQPLLLAEPASDLVGLADERLAVAHADYVQVYRLEAS